MSGRTSLAILLLLIATAAPIPVGLQLTATASAQPSSNSVSAHRIQHVVIIMMENHGYSQVIGSSSAPYQNMLAGKYALASAYYAVTHPSLPNYIAITAGSTLGVTDDCEPSQCGNIGATNVADLLNSAGLSWKEYAESMPVPCDKSPTTLYDVNHNPFVYYRDVVNNTAYCDTHVVPLGNVTSASGPFFSDLNSGSFPNFSFVTPNICDDAHSCPLSVGDKWLSTFVPEILGSHVFNSTVIFITYDEGSSNSGYGVAHGGRVPLIVVGPPSIVNHTVTQVEFDHYSLLATVEAIFGLDSLGRYDISANLLSPIIPELSGASPPTQILPGSSYTPPPSSFLGGTDGVAAIVVFVVLLALGYLAFRRSRRVR
ncbi:MAG: alkaline phosphatase family protein [Thermoprotei archaeon]